MEDKKDIQIDEKDRTFLEWFIASVVIVGLIAMFYAGSRDATWWEAIIVGIIGMIAYVVELVMMVYAMALGQIFILAKNSRRFNRKTKAGRIKWNIFCITVMSLLWVVPIVFYRLGYVWGGWGVSLFSGFAFSLGFFIMLFLISASMSRGGRKFLREWMAEDKKRREKKQEEKELKRARFWYNWHYGPSFMDRFRDDDPWKDDSWRY